MASFHHRVKSGKKGTAADHAAYIARKGKHSTRTDLIATGSGNMPSWVGDNPADFWRFGDKYERNNGAVYREHEIALPSELTLAQLFNLVRELVENIVGSKPYQWAMHAPNSALEGAANPHVHLMFSDRLDDGIERPPEQTFRRYNPKYPENGGRKKASGGKRLMEMGEELIETRRKCAELQNTALAQHGHIARVDHRTLRDQGTSRAPETHLGPARIRGMSIEDRERYVHNRHVYSDSCRRSNDSHSS
jgi:hypothetical protein